MEDSMNNYRRNMPHYDSMPHHYNPMGINDYKVSNNSRMQITNTMPTMPGMPEIYQRPFIPEAEIPLEIDGDMPALPRMPDTQMSGLIPPWLLEMPGMQQPGMSMMPGMPNGMPQPGMPMMPGMPNGMPQQGMPMMPGMPNGMPQQGMPMMPGMPPDGNMYPSMPEMPNGMFPITCEQLREIMRLMNCPMNENDTTNEQGAVQPENTTPMNEDM